MGTIYCDEIFCRAKKRFLKERKRADKTSTSPKTIQNRVNILHQKQNCGPISNFQRKNIKNSQYFF